jgi:predicted ATPase
MKSLYPLARAERVMIEHVEFRNFKGLRHVNLDLERFTVLVGPNASGKTSILEGMHYLTQLASRLPNEVFEVSRGVPFVIYTRGGEGPMELSIINRGGGRVRLEATHHGPIPEDIFHPQLASQHSDKWSFQIARYIPDLEGGKWASVNGSALSGLFPATVSLRLDARRLAEPSYVPNPKPQMQSDGEGLPSVVAHMAGNRPREFARLKRAMRSVLPSVKHIRTDRVSVVRAEQQLDYRDGGTNFVRVEREYVGDGLIFDLKGAPNIPARMSGEGTVLVLGLLTVLMGPASPKLILLDDLDHGLHPKAQRDLIVQLRKIMEQNPELQIVASTHSPYLLEEVKAEEVRLTTLQADGSVACARLDEHPEFEKWKDEMTPGEFWSFVGEKWVAERQAVESR